MYNALFVGLEPSCSESEDVLQNGTSYIKKLQEISQKCGNNNCIYQYIEQEDWRAYRAMQKMHNFIKKYIDGNCGGFW
ncbi:hypothetical protein OESDEN_11157 [Oesophagostomum dentatum]|uniref:Uncharacterized protein n=1 Tax=Oesophagostomum dentatum TaxID=61180 RepID=A0A0B1SZU2_OESDE|nr:hypothetical protein OESDEN_11157 [Oesophagostomum dentatum]